MVSPDEKQRVFKSVIASDRWQPGKRSEADGQKRNPSSADPAEDEDEEIDEEINDAGEAGGGSELPDAGDQVLFPMEMHPKACNWAWPSAHATLSV